MRLGPPCLLHHRALRVLLTLPCRFRALCRLPPCCTGVLSARHGAARCRPRCRVAARLPPRRYSEYPRQWQCDLQDFVTTAPVDVADRAFERALSYVVGSHSESMAARSQLSTFECGPKCSRGDSLRSSRCHRRLRPSGGLAEGHTQPHSPASSPSGSIIRLGGPISTALVPAPHLKPSGCHHKWLGCLEDLSSDGRKV